MRTRMAVVLFALLAYVPAMALAQERVVYVPFDAGLALPLTGGTLTGPLVLTDGSLANPSLKFGNGSGMYRGAGDGIYFVTSAADRFQVSSSGLSGSGFGITSAAVAWAGGYGLGPLGTVAWRPTAGGAPDLLVGRGGAAATLQQGGPDAAAPVNQTLQAQGVSAGTSDTAGASFILRPGVGRGNAVPAPLVLNRSVVTTTTLTSGGLTIFYNTSATSATAADADTGQVNVSWNNVAGTVAAAMGTVINAVQSNSSGTLASTPTVTVATNVVSIKLTPTWATIVPTGVRGTFTVLNHGLDPVVCQ